MKIVLEWFFLGHQEGLGSQPVLSARLPHGVDHDEEDQQNGAAGEAQPVVGDLDVLGREDRGADLPNVAARFGSFRLVSARSPARFDPPFSPLIVVLLWLVAGISPNMRKKCPFRLRPYTAQLSPLQIWMCRSPNVGLLPRKQGFQEGSWNGL